MQLPEYNVEIEIDNTRYLLDRLKKGELDFALIEGFFDSNEFLSRVYRSENFVGVCSKNHRFANKTILPDDIFTEHLFCVKRVLEHEIFLSRFYRNITERQSILQE